MNITEIDLDPNSATLNADKIYRFESYKPEITTSQYGYLPTIDRLSESVLRDSLPSRIKQLSESFFESLYQVDRCINVKVPSQRLRDALVEIWTKEKASQLFETALYLTGAAGAGFLGLYTIPSIWAISAYSLIQIAIKCGRIQRASSQIAGWSASPLEKIAEERTRSYKNGFLYAYHNNLRLNTVSNHAVLLPFEVQFLHEQYLRKTATEMTRLSCTTDSEKKCFLDRFRTDCPIADKILRFTYGQIPEKFAKISQNFEGLNSNLRRIHEDFEIMRSENRRKTNETLQEIETKRSILLAPFKENRDALIRQAKSIRDEKVSKKKIEKDLAVHRIKENYKKLEKSYKELEEEEGVDRTKLEKLPNLDEQIKREEAIYEQAVREIEAECEESIRQSVTDYNCNLIVIGIELYFNSKVNEAKKALTDVLESIQTQEESAFSPFYDYAKRMIRSMDLGREESFSYDQDPFIPSQNFHILELPRIEINFVYPKGYS